MKTIIFRWLGVIVTAGLLLGAVYWGVNAYLAIFGANANAIAVAASAAYGSLFLVGAIFITVAQGFGNLNNSYKRMTEEAEEQTKLLRYIAKQNQNKQ